MEKIELNSEQRDINLNTNSLRKTGLLPGIIYGHDFKNIPLKVLTKDFEKVYKKAGESSLISLKINENFYPVIIHEVQHEAIRNAPIHVDFYKVRMDEKINAPVKLIFIGESPAVKELGGILVRIIDEVEVKALPIDLPHELTVDISKLKNFGDSLLIKDILIPKNVEIAIDLETTIAKVQAPRAEEKEEETVATPEEVEIIKKEKKEEEPSEEIKT
ncbi:MAG: 50S ribosomal protein L25 [Parcubacteria group bacterium]|nr:50S ribosomal protein L25 [Parcubacteria group bacterium]